MTTVHALAPAKLNLGLEVLGRRPDGYHDIATVMQTVSVFDRLTVAHAPEVRLAVSDPALAGDDNLALAAALLMLSHDAVDGGASIYLTKRIPAAAGLGGASSDAAATLVALSRLGDISLRAEATSELAVRLGSDVPFLTRGGTALAEGRGELLRSLRPLTGVWFVLVVTATKIPRKTATLYAALAPEDFSSGERVRRLAASIDRGPSLDPLLLANAFWRPLLGLRPELAEIERAFSGAGAPFVALSGSGPTLYSAVSSDAEARAIVRRLRETLPIDARIFVCRPVSRAPLIRIEGG
jgi:4-diphosphocytidyl-2-C-methyl-D-erythritol kinase